MSRHEPKKTGKKKSASRRFSEWPWLAAIAALTCIIYSDIFSYAILNFDDIEYFTNYPEITRLTWNSIVQFFSKHYVLMYQPLPIFSFALNHAVSGTSVAPLHFVNLLFHLINIFLVFRFAWLLTANRAGSLIISALFGVHPMNTEAVTWISARSSSMYTTFYLAALIIYIIYLRKDLKSRYYFICLGFYLLSLFSKAQAVTLPVVMLLIDYFSARPFTKRMILEKLPFFALSIIFGLITLSDPSTQSNITKGMMISYNAADALFLACYSFMFYIVKCILPVQLCSVYVYPPKTGGLLPVEYYLSAVALALLAWLLYKNRKNRKIVFAAGLFLTTIALNIQLIPSRLFIVTDRYGYFPFIGLFLIPVFYFSSSEGAIRKNNTYIIIALFTMLSFYSVASYYRNKVWQNDLTLMTDIIDKNPPVGYIHRAYGIRGLYHASTGNQQEAINDFNEAIKLNPDDSKTYLNRGLVYARSEQNDQALADFSMAIQKDSSIAYTYSYRAIVYYKLKNADAAMNDCNRCLMLDSAFFDCYITRGTLYFEKQQYDASLADLSAAIFYKPDNAIAWKNRGQVYLQTGKNQQACSDLQRAIELGNPDAPQLYNTYCGQK